MQPPAGGPPAVPLPDPIVTTSMMFDLGADPGALEGAAGAVRARGGLATTAQGAVDTASGKIEGEGAWTGDTADSFQEHRRKLTRDLGVIGDAAARAAGVLLDIGGVLRAGQERLDEQRHRLAGVPVTGAAARSPEPGEPDVSVLTFEPRDATQHALVSSAITAALAIRAEVDEELTTQAGRLRGVLYGWSQYDPTHTAPPSLRTVSDQWKPRDVRVMTYNVGQGYKNEPWFMPDQAGGTDAGDIPDAGRVIAGSGADVVAMQEMFREDAERLLEWLNANAGGGWEMHFEQATTKVQYDGSDNPFLPDTEVHDFGNVVLVRTGGDVGDPTQQPGVKIQDSWALGEEDRALQNTEVPLRE